MPRSLATSRVLYFVEQNTMHWPPLFSSMNWKRYFGFSLSRSTKNDWSMPSPLRSSASRRNCFASRRYSSASLSMSTGMVAEKSDMVFSSGVCSSIVFMSSMKPMSSMVSASSSTTWDILSSLMEPRSR